MPSRPPNSTAWSPTSSPRCSASACSTTRPRTRSTVKDTNVSTPEHQALSERIAEQGTVLLKNADGALPLTAGSVRSIAVIGDAAKNPLTAAGGSAAVIPSAPVVTPLDGITARAGAGTTVSYAQGTLGTNPLPAVPASAFSDLTATYYGTADLTGPPIATEPVANLDITGNPAAVGSATTWSARYTGTITAPADGTYRFSLQAGGYVTVFIDDQQVVSFTPMFEPTQNGLVNLTAGGHSIRVEVTPFQHELVTVEKFAITAGLHLGWQPQQDQLVAQAAAAAAAADVAVVVASAPASEGWDRRSLALPADQDAPDFRGRRGQPAHHRGAQHLQRRDDAVARAGRRSRRGVVPGPNRRHGDQPGPVRRRQPVGKAAGHLPRQRPAGPGTLGRRLPR